MAQQHHWESCELPVLLLLLLLSLLLTLGDRWLPQAFLLARITAVPPLEGGALDVGTWRDAAVLPSDYALGTSPLFDPAAALLPANLWRNFSAEQALACLGTLPGATLLVVGDSNSRTVTNALFAMLGAEGVPPEHAHGRFERAWGAARVAFSFAFSLPDIAAAIEEDPWVALPEGSGGALPVGALVLNSGVWDAHNEDWARGVPPELLLQGHAARMAVLLQRLRTHTVPLLQARAAGRLRLVWRTTTPSLAPELSHARMAALAQLDAALLGAWNAEAGARGLPAWELVAAGDAMPAAALDAARLPDSHHPSPEIAALLVQATLNRLCTPRPSLAAVEALGARAEWCDGAGGGAVELCAAILRGSAALVRQGHGRAAAAAVAGAGAEEGARARARAGTLHAAPCPRGSPFAPAAGQCPRVPLP
jgi:hypothetical protein